MSKRSFRTQSELRFRQMLAEPISAATRDKTKALNEFAGVWLLVAQQAKPRLTRWAQQEIFFGVDMGPVLEEAADDIIEAATDEVLKQVSGEPQDPDLVLNDKVDLPLFFAKVCRKHNIPRDLRNRFVTNLTDRKGLSDLKSAFLRSGSRTAFSVTLVQQTTAVALEHPRLERRLPVGVLRQRLVDEGLLDELVEDLWRVLREDGAARIDQRLVKKARALHLTSDIFVGPLVQAIVSSSVLDSTAARRLAADALFALENLRFADEIQPSAASEDDENAPEYLFGVVPFGFTDVSERETFWRLMPRDRLLLLLYLQPFDTVFAFKAMALGVLGQKDYESLQVDSIAGKLAEHLASASYRGCMSAEDLAQLLGRKATTLSKELSILRGAFSAEDDESAAEDRQPTSRRA
ncbi:hypothetical protein [Rubrivivax albus]|uniref:Uncharacterized protein n=1 Tax=Rubrivivax albus TaxID=2499835 RepID=A0A437JLP2_9BURK|nr:hypothetical protein [Rubrivivax albus]RVT47666.1 hypothetical protein ENE75_23895 [Rubrivivax albus]